MNRASFAVLYRSKVCTEDQSAFIAAWIEATKAYRTVGALGSRLRGDVGDFYAYAEWPGRQSWESSNAGDHRSGDGGNDEERTLEFVARPLEVTADLLARAVE